MLIVLLCPEESVPKHLANYTLKLLLPLKQKCWSILSFEQGQNSALRRYVNGAVNWSCLSLQAWTKITRSEMGGEGGGMGGIYIMISL